MECAFWLKKRGCGWGWGVVWSDMIWGISSIFLFFSSSHMSVSESQIPSSGAVALEVIFSLKIGRTNPMTQNLIPFGHFLQMFGRRWLWLPQLTDLFIIIVFYMPYVVRRSCSLEDSIKWNSSLIDLSEQGFVQQRIILRTKMSKTR